MKQSSRARVSRPGRGLSTLHIRSKSGVARLSDASNVAVSVLHEVSPISTCETSQLCSHSSLTLFHSALEGCLHRASAWIIPSGLFPLQAIPTHTLPTQQIQATVAALTSRIESLVQSICEPPARNPDWIFSFEV